MSIESVMLSNHFHPLLPASSIAFSLSCHQGLFQGPLMLPASSGQSIGALASASVFSMSIQGWFPLGLTGLISLQSKGLSRVFSGTTIQRHQFFGIQPSFWSKSYICWRRKWQPTPVLLPGKSHGWRSLVGYSPWWRVGHDWTTSLSLFTFMHWRRKWPPTPVFLPGESQGQRSLVGCRLWSRTESDTTEVT